jgi:hypothetical protein
MSALPLTPQEIDDLLSELTGDSDLYNKPVSDAEFGEFMRLPSNEVCNDPAEKK